MSDKPIIEVSNLWKRYGLPPFLPWRKHKVQEHEWALKDINFSIPRGGSLGVLGRNGAGKSTLLKLLAGVTPPDKGSVTVRGSIFPMIELTAGMSMELSGMENIRILGTIMGLDYQSLEEVVPQVESFSELGVWLKKPVWQYSSGMLARLAFSIAINVKADILLVDEVLAVGDIMFQKKCHAALEKLINSGTTIILITHAPYQVERLCDQGMVMVDGRIDFIGTGKDARASYMGLKASVEDVALSRICGSFTVPEDFPREGSGDMRVTHVRLEDGKGNQVSRIEAGSPLTVKIYYYAHTTLKDVNIALRIKDAEDRLALSFATSSNQVAKIPPGHGMYEFRLESVPLTAGLASLQIKISSAMMLDYIDDMLPFVIHMNTRQALETGGSAYAYAPFTWEHSHGKLPSIQILNELRASDEEGSRGAMLKRHDDAFAEEGFKQSVLSYPPRSVTIGINSACMNRCSFCSYHAKEARELSNVYNVPFSMPVERFSQIANACYQAGVPLVHVCATGEPFLHRQINEILDAQLAICGYLSFQTSFPLQHMRKNNSLEKIFEYAPYIKKITTDILADNPLQHADIKRGSDFEQTLGVLSELSRLGVPLESHFILSKKNYRTLPGLASLLIQRGIACTLAVVNLHPHEFNEDTKVDGVYFAGDSEIAQTLAEVRDICSGTPVTAITPVPFDDPGNRCGSFWTRFQIWPVKNTPRACIDDNIILGGCNAVVRGGLDTLGHFFDHGSLMELWNNEHFVRYREIILNGGLPDDWCRLCANGYHRYKTMNSKDNTGGQ